MGLLNADVIEDLIHSSSVDKGIERTMEHIINELEIDSMYIIHAEENMIEPELIFEWDNTPNRKLCTLETYVRNIEDWFHFDEENIYIARATAVLSKEEKEMYIGNGYNSVVEYKMTNHGNEIGYIVIAWNAIKALSDEEINDVHVIFKLMNDMICRDIFESRYNDSEGNLFRLMSDMTRTLMYVVDDDYHIAYMNNYAKEVYPNIRVGNDVIKAIWDMDEIDKRNPLLMLERNDYVETSLYLPHMDGCFDMTAVKMINENGKTTYAITLRKQYEDTPQKKRASLGRKVIFAMRQLYKDMIAVEVRKDQFYNLFETDVNNRQSYSMDFVLKWLSKVHIDDKQRFLECFDVNFLQNAFMHGEMRKDIDFRYRTHEGEYHTMYGQVMFENNSNKDVTVYILFQDVEQVRSAQIMEEKKMREAYLAAKSAAELKGQVLSSISHEIRNPMSGIISMSGVARRVYKDEERLLECLANIDDYSEHMMQVMDAMLAVVKVDDNAISIANQPFRLESLLNKIDVRMRESIEKNNLQFRTDLKCQYTQVSGDEVRLQQVIVYLIDNAVANMPIAGDIVLSAHQVAADKKTVYIRFSLDYSGNGFTDNMKKSMFGVAKDSEGPLEGEAFNLSLVARLIELMKGQIGILVDEAGTHLNFTIPLAIYDVERKKPVKKRAATELESFMGMKILLAEDDDMSRDAIKAVLEVAGFSVDTVDNGRKAVIQYISQPANTYNAILMDVHMPLMDGREATKCIRISGKEDGEEIPIIGMMADTDDGDVEDSLQSGMQAHLGKPVDVDLLYKVLERYLEKEDL